MKPRLLIVNDDGITSPFLPVFARRLAEVARVAIVVPAREQSWIGRAFSRHSEVNVERREFFGFDCRAVGGTPADCANIALSHIFARRRPDAVVSGLNIGQNVAMPLLWSSGTFGAAVEAAGLGFPSFAFSMRLENKYYEMCRLRHEGLPADLLSHVDAACAHAASYIVKSLEKPFKAGEVRNVNYPANFGPHTPFKKCVPAKMGLVGLYKKNARGNYEFSYALGSERRQSALTDIQALDMGFACWSKISV